MIPSKPTWPAAAVVTIVAIALCADVSVLWGNRLIGAVIAIAAAGWMLLWPVSDDTDGEACRTCTHPRDEHHGICQACQRDVVNGVPSAPDFACERFSVR